MTKQNTHPENNDWQEPVVEQLSVSEPSLPSETENVSSEGTPAKAEEERSNEISARAAADDEVITSGEEAKTQEDQPPSIPASPTSEANFESPRQEETPTEETEAPLTPDVPVASAEEQVANENGSASLFNQEQVQSPLAESTVRPFTDFIEEFRQTEVRLNSLLTEQETSFTSLATENEAGTVSFLETSTSETSLKLSGENSSTPDVTPEKTNKEIGSVLSNLLGETKTPLTQPSLSTERPVSPLLRPATRLRLPRHSRHRIEEIIEPAELKTEPAKPVAEQPVAETSQAEEQPARPARRYRFDRPAASANTTSTPARNVAREPEVKEKRENNTTTEQTTTRPGNNGVVAPEVTVQKNAVQETAPVILESETPPVPERRRRNNHERQREKEQAAPAQVIPTIQVTPPEPEPEPVTPVEVPIEELPPLEYSELQAATSRRRRRRRTGSVTTTVASNGAVPLAPVQPKIAPSEPQVVPPVVALPKSTPPAPVVPQTYNIVSGYTVSQMNQGNELSGPFMGPEPSPARGSTFSNAPALRHVRNEALRNVPAKHNGEALLPSSSINYLANSLVQAVQTQTDRMVAELRRANQVPTNVSVSLPPFPSTERVGVFVDVANLLYSARTLRMTVDFGKLLDFLRGNRRLVRAQAYCPTSPQPGDDQMFLQAVKGLGYRITTKNYKTFSSGAKKADLDLDLCMDVVRLVDGKAVDCIVLVSGDSDFMPMLDYCSDHGVRVEVAAFDESMSATLRQSCDLFVNLSMLEEIRA